MRIVVLSSALVALIFCLVTAAPRKTISNKNTKVIENTDFNLEKENEQKAFEPKKVLKKHADYYAIESAPVAESVAEDDVLNRQKKESVCQWASPGTARGAELAFGTPQMGVSGIYPIGPYPENQVSRGGNSALQGSMSVQYPENQVSRSGNPVFRGGMSGNIAQYPQNQVSRSGNPALQGGMSGTYRTYSIGQYPQNQVTRDRHPVLQGGMSGTYRTYSTGQYPENQVSRGGNPVLQGQYRQYQASTPGSSEMMSPTQMSQNPYTVVQLPPYPSGGQQFVSKCIPIEQYQQLTNQGSLPDQNTGFFVNSGSMRLSSDDPSARGP